MTEGFWINYKTGKVVPIDEHERSIRRPDVAKKLGVSALEKEFSKFKLEKDREKFLLWLMKSAPLMRVRGHGTEVTFDFDSRSRLDPLDAIAEFGRNNLGPFSRMTINNYATKEMNYLSFQQFEELMDTSGPEGVLRIGSKNLAKALRKIAVEIDMAKILKK